MTKQIVLTEQQLAGIIAGAIFDFAGHLTTRPRTLFVGQTSECSPIADEIVLWARQRELSLDSPYVRQWEDIVSGKINADDAVGD